MNKDIKRITVVEFFVLFIMFGCFAAALFFILRENRLYSLVFCIMHGLLAVVYIFLSQDRITKVILDVNDKSAKLLDIEREVEAGSIEKLKKENDRLTQQAEKLNRDKEQLADENRKLSLSLEEKNAAVSYAENRRQYNMLLPENELTTATDIIGAIRKVYDKFDGRCAQSGIRLGLSTTAGRFPMICDERFLIVMFSDIVDNAVKYMNRNGSFLITVSDIGEEGIFIVCKDNGEGLPATEVPYIFGLNFQGSNRRSGNGLGLAQVKAVVEHYGGTVYAKSDLDEGMAIYIQFPAYNKG